MSKIISSFVYAFAANTWQLYLGPLAEILNGTSFIAMRSIASKLVQSDELVRLKINFMIKLYDLKKTFLREKLIRYLASVKRSCHYSTRQCIRKFTEQQSIHYREHSFY